MDGENIEEVGCPRKATINDLPEEILEFILMKLSPYRDLKAASSVCHLWYKLVQVVLRKLQNHYHQSVWTSRLAWSTIRPDTGCRITERYSHSCCYYDKCLYVFGGCTATNTTLNDLWKFDLASREWIRPLAMGTYPFPKACASLVVYKDNLVLFGGWSHPTPFPLHQAARFFSELHIYKPSLNRWSHVVTLSHQSPQPVAGHSASVLGDLMVVFGGSQVPGVRTNDVWVFDFLEVAWKQPRTSNRRPAPRYGQTQVTLDDKHILILGGKGGGGSPHLVYKDCWLLTVGDDEWTWEQIEVNNDDCAPAQLWCHSACKVSDSMIVTLCKAAKLPDISPQSTVSKKHSKKYFKLWVPPKDGKSSETCTVGSENDVTVEMDQSGASGVSHDSALTNQNGEKSSSDSLDMDQESDDSSDSGQSNGQEERTIRPRPGLPSVRPNAMKNRQRQLEALLKYEKKFRNSENSGSPSPPNDINQPSTSGAGFGQPSANMASIWPNKPEKPVNRSSLMVLHVLDISNVLERKTVSWQKLNFDHLLDAPEETIFYSLVEGRGELLMFGGIERDIHSLKSDYGFKAHIVNNSLHVLSPIQDLL